MHTDPLVDVTTLLGVEAEDCEEESGITLLYRVRGGMAVYGSASHSRRATHASRKVIMSIAAMFR